MPLLKKILKWVVIVLVLGYVLLVIGRVFVLNNADKTAAAVARIHATKLTLDDVMGKSLPAAFAPASASQAYYDATVAGVDANKNGIRDDVELAIFKEYPVSAKTRAVLLQYALALQMEMTQSLVNAETVTAVAEEKSRASMCIGDIITRDDLKKFITVTNGLVDFATKTQINNKTRDEVEKTFYKSLGSYSSLEGTCDIELASLPN